MSRDNGMTSSKEYEWTDDHIFYDAMTEEWVAYDEAGMEYGRYDRYDYAVDSLIVYAYNLEKELNKYA